MREFSRFAHQNERDKALSQLGHGGARLEEMMAKRTAYLNVPHNRAEKGSQSRSALSEAQVLRRMRTPDNDRVCAAANLRLGQFLNET